MKFIKYSNTVFNVKEIQSINLKEDSIVINFYENIFWYLEMKKKERLPMYFYLICNDLDCKDNLICDLDHLKIDKHYLF